MEPRGFLSRVFPAIAAACLLLSTTAPTTAAAATVPPPTPARLTLVLTTFDTYNRAGLIDSQTVAASLRSKITHAQQLLTGTALNGPAQAQQSLQAFVDELNGQDHNHVVKSASDTLTAEASGAPPPTQFTVAPSTTTTTTVATAVTTTTTSGGTTTTTTNPVVVTLPPATNVSTITVTAPPPNTPLPAPPPGGQTLVATTVTASYSSGTQLSAPATVTSTFTPGPGVNPLSAAIYTLDPNNSNLTQKLLSTVTKNPDGTYTVTAQTTHFTPFVTMASAPTVTSVTPVYGPQAGGTTVDVNGAGFTGATNVLFNNVSAASFTPDVNNPDSHLTATSPAGSAGPAIDVQVVTPFGTSTASSADHFTYFAPVDATGSAYAPATVYTGNTVTFVGAATGGYPAGTYSWLWTFDDGTTSTAQSPQRQFNNPGTFTETVRATDSIGNSNTASLSVPVILPSIGGVVSAGGAPAPGVTVTVWNCVQVPGDGCSSLTQVGGSTTTATDGSYAIQVPNGNSYRVQFGQTPTLVGQWNGGAPRAGRAANVVVNGAPVTVNATMQAGHQVTGTVTNASNTGVGGVFVAAAINTPACCSPGPFTTTDGAGNYALTLADGSYNLNLGPPAGYLPANRQLTMNGAAQTVNFTLVSGDIISGTVSYGGGPLANVSVQAFDPASGQPVGSNGFTDQSGFYQVTVPKGGTADDILFQPSGSNAAPQWYAGVSSVSQATPVPHPTPSVNITLPSGFHISGTVHGANNTLLAGIPVSAFDPATATRCCYGPISGTQTDANGHYTLTVPSGSWLVQFNGPGFQKYVHQWWQNANDPNGATQVTVNSATGDATGISPTLQPGFYVSGRVTGTNGALLQGIKVNAMAPGCCQSFGGTQSDGGGNYQLLVPAGTYVIAFNQDEAQGYLPLYSGNTILQGAATPITVNADVTGQNASLQTGYPITGTVLGANNAPLAGINVSANQFNAGKGGFGAGTQTDQKGTYTLLVPAGIAVIVQFNPDQRQGYLSQFWNNVSTPDQASQITLSATNPSAANVNATLQLGVPISGIITDAAGKPVPNAPVIATPTCNKGCFQNAFFTQADGSGNYTVLVSNGTYLVGAASAQNTNQMNTWYGGTVDAQAATPVIVSGNPVPNINIQLLPTYPLSGQVTVPGGGPAAGVQVSLNGFNPDGSCCFGGGQTQTDAAGNYSFAVAAGTWQVQVNSPQYVPAQANVTVSAPGATQNFALQAGFPVSGTITAGGQPAAGVNVSFNLANPDGSCCGQFVGGTQTNPDGTYSVTLANGTYWAFVNPPPGFAQYSTQLVVNGAPVPLSVALVAGITVTGTVTAADTGKGLPNVGLGFNLANPNGSCCAQGPNANFGGGTDPNGNFSITLPAGTYYANFGPSGSYVQLNEQVVVSQGMTPLNVSLQPGIAISGTVIAADTGKGLGGVQVNVSSPDGNGNCCGQFAAGTPTNPDGTYSLVVVAGTYFLTFYPPAGYISTTPLAITVATNPLTENATVSRGEIVSGTVTGAGAGPLAQVNVNLNPANNDGSCCAQGGLGAQTDQNGAYSVTVPPGTYYVFIGPTNGFAQYQAKLTISGNTTLNATLPVGYTLSGTVSVAGGGPLGGVQVNVSQANANGTCCGAFVGGQPDNADGTYSFTVAPGTYIVQFFPPPGYLASTSAAITVTNTGVTVNGTITPGVLVSGTVTSAGGGAPIQGVNVNFSQPDANGNCCGAFAAGAQTGANGGYSLTVAAGTYIVTFNPPSAFASAQQKVTVSGSSANVSAALQPAFPVQGTVRDATTNAPLAGVQVNVSFPNAGGNCCGSGAGGATTAADGTYSVPVAPGTYFVTFFPPAGHLASQPVAVTVTNAAVTVDGSLQAGTIVSGTVTQPGGAPISRVTVEALAPGSCCPGNQATTDANGVYQLTLGAGSWRLGFMPLQTSGLAGQFYDGSPTGTALPSHAVALAVSGATMTVNAALQAGVLISGQVLRAPNQGIAGVPVNAQDPAQAGQCCSIPPISSTQTDSGGNYAMYVPAGSWIVQFGNDPTGTYVGQYYPGVYTENLATLVAAPKSGVNGTLANGYLISGTVTAGGGGPLAGVDIGVCTTNGVTTGCSTGFAAGTTTHTDGTYSLLLPNGSFDLFFGPASGYLTVIQPITVNGAARTVDQALQPAVTVSGQVTDAAGHPLPGVQVEAGSSTGGCCVGQTTDGGGNYTLTLPNGSYLLHFRPAPGSGLAPVYYGGSATAGGATMVNVAGSALTGVGAALPAGTTISGTVSASDTGAGIGAVYVSAHASSDPFWAPAAAAATTIADGTYSMAAPNGTFNMGFNPPTQPTGYLSSSTPTPVSVSGTPLTGVNAVLQPGVMVSGQVTDQATGAGISGVNVSASPGPGATPTDATGHYALMVPTGSTQSFTFSPPAPYNAITTAPAAINAPTTINEALT